MDKFRRLIMNSVWVRGVSIASFVDATFVSFVEDPDIDPLFCFFKSKSCITLIRLHHLDRENRVDSRIISDGVARPKLFEASSRFPVYVIDNAAVKHSLTTVGSGCSLGGSLF